MTATVEARTGAVALLEQANHAAALEMAKAKQRAAEMVPSRAPHPTPCQGQQVHAPRSLGTPGAGGRWRRRTRWANSAWRRRAPSPRKFSSRSTRRCPAPPVQRQRWADAVRSPGRRRRRGPARRRGCRARSRSRTSGSGRCATPRARRTSWSMSAAAASTSPSWLVATSATWSGNPSPPITTPSTAAAPLSARRGAATQRWTHTW